MASSTQQIRTGAGPGIHVLCFLTYVLLAVAGLQLSLPPIIAAPFWPAAGFATVFVLRWGYRLLPTLALASLAGNISHLLLQSGSIDWSRQWLLILLIALGTMLRAALGAWLIERFLWRSGDDRNQRMLLPIVAAGPVASVLSTLAGIIGLLAVGFIDLAGLPFAALIWWLGDCIGIIATWSLAVALCWPQRGQPLRRGMLVVMPVLGLALVTLLVFMMLREHGRVEVRQRARQIADTQASQLRRAIEDNLDFQNSMMSFFQSSDRVELDEYRRFLGNLLPSRPSVHGLAWVQSVSAEQRPAFVADMRKLGFPDFEIWQPGKGGGRQAVRPGERCAVITFHEPFERNRRAHGLDVFRSLSASNYRVAESERRVVTSGPQRLVQETGDQRGVIIIRPLWLHRTQAGPADGFLSLVLRCDDLVRVALDHYDQGTMSIKLHDGIVADSLLYHDGVAEQDLALDLRQERRIELPGRHWRLLVTPTRAWQTSMQDWQSWLVLLGGMLLCGMLGQLLHAMAHRQEIIEGQVQQQTRALAGANADLRRARDAAEAANHAKSAFLATMSHEIRTPMVGVLGMIDALLDSDLDRQQREQASIARSSGRALLELLNDVLDLAKFEAGRFELMPQSVEIRRLGEEACRLFSQQAAKKGLRLWCLIEPSVPQRVQVDPARLRQLMINLLGNAIKFTEEGWVSLRLRWHDEQLGIDVSDSGIGIADGDQGQLFDEFRQVDADADRRYEGTGLGLAICKHIVEAMKGRISVTSRLQEGSCFRIDIPLPAEAASPSPPRRGQRALVLGEDPRWRQAVSCCAAACGLELCDDAADADLQLCDLDQVSKRIDGLPMIGFSAGSSTEHTARHLRMPLTASDLALALDTLDAPPEVVAGADPVERAALEGVTVLLVEDNPVNRRVAGYHLEKIGCRVLVAEDGEQALLLLCGHGPRPDLVFMDIQMPGLDGYECTRRIRRHEAEHGLARLPVIAMTANALSGDRERCLEAGMDDHLPKPVEREGMQACIERWAGSA